MPVLNAEITFLGGEQLMLLSWTKLVIKYRLSLKWSFKIYAQNTQKTDISLSCLINSVTPKKIQRICCGLIFVFFFFFLLWLNICLNQFDYYSLSQIMIVKIFYWLSLYCILLKERNFMEMRLQYICKCISWEKWNLDQTLSMPQSKISWPQFAGSLSRTLTPSFLNQRTIPRWRLRNWYSTVSYSAYNLERAKYSLYQRINSEGVKMLKKYVKTKALYQCYHNLWFSLKSGVSVKFPSIKQLVWYVEFPTVSQNHSYS